MLGGKENGSSASRTSNGGKFALRLIEIEGTRRLLRT